MPTTLFNCTHQAHLRYSDDLTTAAEQVGEQFKSQVQAIIFPIQQTCKNELHSKWLGTGIFETSSLARPLYTAKRPVLSAKLDQMCLTNKSLHCKN